MAPPRRHAPGHRRRRRHAPRQNRLGRNRATPGNHGHRLAGVLRGRPAGRRPAGRRTGTPAVGRPRPPMGPRPRRTPAATTPGTPSGRPGRPPPTPATGRDRPRRSGRTHRRGTAGGGRLHPAPPPPSGHGNGNSPAAHSTPRPAGSITNLARSASCVTCRTFGLAGRTSRCTPGLALNNPGLARGGTHRRVICTLIRGDRCGTAWITTHGTDPPRRLSTAPPPQAAISAARGIHGIPGATIPGADRRRPPQRRAASRNT